MANLIFSLPAIKPESFRKAAENKFWNLSSESVYKTLSSTLPALTQPPKHAQNSSKLKSPLMEKTVASRERKSREYGSFIRSKTAIISAREREGYRPRIKKYVFIITNQYSVRCPNCSIINVGRLFSFACYVSRT